MTLEERGNYSYYRKKLYNDRDELQAAEARGVDIGKAEEKNEIARAMLLDGDSVKKDLKSPACLLLKLRNLQLETLYNFL